jgi:hypothetical protein
MRDIENHMVALSQPELEYEPKCDCKEWSIVKIEDFNEDYVDFKIVCDICNKEGYRSYELKFIDMVWD